MIKRPSNWDTVQAFTDRKTLPVDAYVCRIQNAVVKKASNGADQLCILFDISEGEQAGFFTEEYNQNTFDGKKYKGVLRLWIPTDDGSDQDEKTKRNLKAFITAVCNSNRSYVWQWDETTLKGLEIGIIFRSEEWDYDGKHGWATRPFRATTSDKVRAGDYTIPEPKALVTLSQPVYTPAVPAVPAAPANAYVPAAPTYTAGFPVLADDDSELPF